VAHAQGEASVTRMDGGGSPRHDAARADHADGADRVDDADHVDRSAPPDAAVRLVAYASGYGPDLYVYSVDAVTGALTTTQSLTAFGTSPSFLAINAARNRLYAVDEATAGRVGAYAIDEATGALTFLNAVSSGGEGPPFVTVDGTGKWVFVANYGDGTVSVLPVQGDGSLGNPATTLTVGMNAHMMIADPSNRFVFVPCLGADYVAQFSFDDDSGALTPNATAPYVAAAVGAGPRHLAFHPNGRFAYVINETSSTLTLYAFDANAGTLSEIDTQSTLPPSFSGTNTAAEVHVHPSGAWLIASNRGADDLVVFAVDATTGMLSTPSFTPSGGAMPRDFTLSPDGSKVYAANQGAGNVVPFMFDATHGALATTGSPVSVAAASFVGLVALP
jgi:6-phosphogluconolactonase